MSDDAAVTLHLQRVYRGRIPTRKLLVSWFDGVLRRYRTRSELTLRVVGIIESAQLNQTWRHREGPTNVLSFPAEGLEAITPSFIGDIVICAPLVRQEAAAQHKALQAHWAHLVVHGTLHLLGYDHTKSPDARKMETLEKKFLATLGYPDPYN
jgi:probable rRNA maturation factor